MEKYDLPTFIKLMESGPVGMLVGITLLGLGFYLRNKGWLTSDKEKVVSHTQLADLSNKVGAIDVRVRSVENDLLHRPTRQELHAQEVKITRLEEQMNALVRTTTATNHAVGRIEDYLINDPKRTKK